MVYTIVRETDDGGAWTVHRNMLTPCEHLILDEPVDQDTGLSKRVTRSSRSPALAAQENSASDTDDDDELSFMPALSSRSNAGMAAIPTSNENEAFSAVDEVNDDEVSELPIDKGDDETPTSAEPTTDDQAEQLLITHKSTESNKGCDKGTLRSHKENNEIPSTISEQNERLLTTQESEAESDRGSSEDTLQIAEVADELSLIIDHEDDSTKPKTTTASRNEMTNLQAEIPLADGGPTSSELLQEPEVSESAG